MDEIKFFATYKKDCGDDVLINPQNVKYVEDINEDVCSGFLWAMEGGK